MSEIPEDVRRSAFKFATDAIGGMCMTMDHSFGLQSPEERQGLELSMRQLAHHDVAGAVTKAILAERERCAKIAEKYRHYTIENWAGDIADEIRGTSPS